MMGSHIAPRIKEYIEHGNETEYIVNHVTHEPAPGGMMRIFAWKMIHGKYVLQYTVLTPAPALIQIGRQHMQATEAIDLSQFEEDFREH